jgi:hypothetical protein
MPNTITAAGTTPLTVRLDTTGQFVLGDADEGLVSSWVLQVSGTFSGSLVLRKEVRQSTVPAASAPTTTYENFASGNPVAAGTAITAAGLFKVLCDGCSLILDYTATSGVMVVECVPLAG